MSPQMTNEDQVPIQSVDWAKNHEPARKQHWGGDHVSQPDKVRQPEWVMRAGRGLKRDWVEGNEWIQKNKKLRYIIVVFTLMNSSTYQNW